MGLLFLEDIFHLVKEITVPVIKQCFLSTSDSENAFLFVCF